jgi:hypothetical protein
MTLSLALSLGMTPASAQEKKISFLSNQSDPFEVSNERCNTIKALSCAMVKAGPAGSNITVGEVAAELNITFQRILKLNTWNSKDVSLDTRIPPNKKFAVRRKY